MWKNQEGEFQEILKKDNKLVRIVHFWSTSGGGRDRHELLTVTS